MAASDIATTMNLKAVAVALLATGASASGRDSATNQAPKWVKDIPDYIKMGTIVKVAGAKYAPHQSGCAKTFGETFTKIKKRPYIHPISYLEIRPEAGYETEIAEKEYFGDVNERGTVLVQVDLGRGMGLRVKPCFDDPSDILANEGEDLEYLEVGNQITLLGLCARRRREKYTPSLRNKNMNLCQDVIMKVYEDLDVKRDGQSLVPSYEAAKSTMMSFLEKNFKDIAYEKVYPEVLKLFNWNTVEDYENGSTDWDEVPNNSEEDHDTRRRLVEAERQMSSK